MKIEPTFNPPPAQTIVLYLQASVTGDEIFRDLTKWGKKESLQSTKHSPPPCGFSLSKRVHLIHLA